MIPANESALEKTNPSLLAAISAARPSDRIELVPSRRGPPTLVWIDSDGRRKFLHSPVDPAAESRKVAEAAVGGVGSAARAILIGHGAGYEIRALAERVEELWVLAANLTLLRFVCDRLDLSDVLMNPKVRWLFGTPSEVSSQLKTLTRSAGADLPTMEVVIHPPLLEPIPAEFETVVAIVRQIQSGRDTEDLIGPIARENFRKNYSALASAGVRTLFGTAGGRPVIVAGAGPTLDDSLPVMRDLYPFSYLIAVDTVADGLAGEGLEPDLVVSVDPRPDSLIHFQSLTDAGPRRSILVFTPITYPDIVKAFEGRRLVAIPKNHFFLKPAEPILRDKGMLLSGGSVSILAASLAAALGPAYVCVTGVDFRATRRKFYSNLATYIRHIPIHGDRLVNPETREYEIVSREFHETSAGLATPRLEHYAADFRCLLKGSLVPFYSIGPAPMPGVRSGILPCTDRISLRRPIEIPPAAANPPAGLFEVLGMRP